MDAVCFVGVAVGFVLVRRQQCGTTQKHPSQHAVFGIEREIDISVEVFPTKEELNEMEGRMPPCEHGWFDSVYDSAKLHYRAWVPASNNPRAVVIFMHGIHTHSGKTQNRVAENGLEFIPLNSHTLVRHSVSYCEKQQAKQSC
jgi:hypothetical protein